MGVGPSRLSVQIDMPPKKDDAPALEALLAWVSERVRAGDPPRVGDMLEHAKRERLGKISRKTLNDALLVDPVYMFNLHQQK